MTPRASSTSGIMVSPNKVRLAKENSRGIRQRFTSEERPTAPERTKAPPSIGLLGKRLGAACLSIRWGRRQGIFGADYIKLTARSGHSPRRRKSGPSVADGYTLSLITCTHEQTKLFIDESGVLAAGA